MNGLRTGVACAFARIRSRPLRNAVAALSVAAAVTTLTLVTLIGNASGPESIRRTIAELPSDQRSLTVVYAPADNPTRAEVERIRADIGQRLRLPGLVDTTGVVEYRPLAIGTGGSFRFVGVDGMTSRFRLRSGRFPRTCADECEVVVLHRARPSTDRAALSFDARFRLRVVGEVEARSDAFLSGQLQPDPDEEVVLAEGVMAASAFKPFALYVRIFGWQSPLDPSSLSERTISVLYAATGRINRIPSVEGVRATLPDGPLRSSLARSLSTRHRLAYPRAMAVLLGAGIAALLGFGMRTDHRRAVVLLRRRSADPVVVAAFRLTETLVPVLGGTVIALVVSSSVGPRVAMSMVNSPLRPGWNRLFDSGDRIWFAATVIAFVAITIAAVTVRDHAPVKRFGATDVIGIVSLSALVFIVNRDPGRLTSVTRFDSAFIALPVLAALVVCAVAVRITPPSVSGIASILRSRPLKRLGFVDSLRQPWRPLATLCLLTTTVMFVTVAVGYRSTLHVGVRDQAAFAVPYDARIRIGPYLIRPRSVEPPRGWSSLSPGSVSTEVLRRGATIRGQGTESATIELLGLDPSTLSALHGWRPAFGVDPADLAPSLGGTAVDPGLELPVGTRQVHLSGSGFAGLSVSVITTHADGLWREMETTGDSGERTATYDDQMLGHPPIRIVGFRIAVPSSAARLIEHKIGEGTTSTSSTPYDISLTAIDALTANGTRTRVAMDARTWRSSRAVVRSGIDSVRASGLLLGQSAIVSARAERFQDPIPALVDPETLRLASHGIVWIDAGTGRLPLRPIGSAVRFPGALQRFAVTDRALLEPLLDLIEPGFGAANEAWIGRPGRTGTQVAVSLGRALAAPAFSDLMVSLRRTEELRRENDPLSRATLAILLVCSLTSLLLASLFLQFSTVSDRLDDRELHRTLALQGVKPGDLVRLLFTKSLIGFIPAIPIGVVGGIWLLRTTTRVLPVGVDGGVPLPELRVSFPWLTMATGGACFAVITVLLCWLAARPVRNLPSEDLLRGTI